jgi:hypothetical protein
MVIRFIVGMAIALLFVFGSGIVRAASLQSAGDFTRLNQAQPECKGDQDDCE